MWDDEGALWFWQKQGTRREAYALLGPVSNGFTAGFDTSRLERRESTAR